MNKVFLLFSLTLIYDCLASGAELADKREPVFYSSNIFGELKTLKNIDIKNPGTEQASSWIKLDTTTIIGSTEDVIRTAGSAHLLDQEALEVYNYDDIHRVLNQIPGVYIREEDGYGLRPNIGFRGADSNRSRKVVLMEDGILFGPAPYSAPAAYFFPIPSRMSAVEVFKGPVSIQHGPNTIGGAINLQTKDIPFEREGQLDFLFGTESYQKGVFSHGQQLGQIGYIFDLAHLRSDGFKDLDGGGDTGFDKTETMLKLQWQTDRASRFYQRLNLKLGYSEETSNETYLGLSDKDFDSNPYRRYRASKDDLMEWERKNIALSHFMSFSESFDLQSSIYYHEFSRTWSKVDGFSDGTAFLDVFNGSATNSSSYMAVLRGQQDSSTVSDFLYGRNARDYISQGIQMDGIWYFDGTRHQQTKFGIRVHGDQVERDHDATRRSLSSGEFTDMDSPVSTRINRDETEAISVYVLHEMNLGSVTLKPGMRMEMMDMSSYEKINNTRDERRDEVFLPGLSLSYPFKKRWFFLAGGHKGFSPVTPGQAQNIVEEQSWNYEVGLRYDKQDFHLEWIGFFNDYSNLLGEETLSTGGTAATIGQQYNGGEVDVYGLEFLLSDEFELSYLTLPVRFNYTYTKAEFQTSFDSPYYGYARKNTSTDEIVLAGDPLPYVPEHMLQLDLGWHIPAWKFHLNGKYQSEMVELASYDRTDSYWTFDFSSTYVWNKKREMVFKVDNLLDKSNIVGRRPYGARSGKPRQVLVGARLKF